MGSPEATRRASRAPTSVVVFAATQVRVRQLERLIAGSELSLAGSAQTAEAAEARVTGATPGAVLVDLSEPSAGLEAIERIMAVRATPIVVIGASPADAQAALSAGAVDIVGLDESGVGAALGDLLRGRLRDASRVKVITHPRARLRASRVDARPANQDAGADAGPEVRGDARTGARPEVASNSRSSARTDAGAEGEDSLAPLTLPLVVAIGASTGGPPALSAVLRHLPEDLPAAVVVVQHMAEGFIEGLAHWLDDISALPVSVAVDGQRLQPGAIYLAPAGLNLRLVRSGRIELLPPDPGQYHVPGVDATFNSVARICRERAVGVLLTGMGRDGAAGLLAMRRAGAHTLGQDEESSAVWGMPAAARALLAVDDELALSDIGPAIVAAVHRCLQPLGGG